MRIVLTGGGTGGHIFPLVAVARKIREKFGSEVELLYIGSGNKLEREVFSQEEIRMKRVLSGKMRRYFSFRNITDVFRIAAGFFQSLWMLLWYMPDVIFSKGGYVSFPVALAGWLYRVPVLTHESDAAPGLANRILAKFSARVAVAYPSAENYFSAGKTALTGNPIRDEIAQGDTAAARSRFDLTESKPVILVLGGSQGSRMINTAVIKILPKILERAQVIHQTGDDNYQDVIHFAAEMGIKAGREGYYPAAFLSAEDLKNAYAVSDLVISRAGANSIAETAANRKPAILIPLNGAANDHQRMNAYELARIGGALVLEEGNLGENIFLEKIMIILDDKNLQNSMAQKISVFYHPEAAEKIVQGLAELVS